jgi:hypothetical protein
MNTKTRFTILTIAVMTLSLTFSSIVIVNEASAAITQHCKNPSGNEPQGNCQGQALKKVNENPAGKEPPGQNK